eukprot:1680849-Pyramimonas_sp.AAC.1
MTKWGYLKRLLVPGTVVAVQETHGSAELLSQTLARMGPGWQVRHSPHRDAGAGGVATFWPALV